MPWSVAQSSTLLGFFVKPRLLRPRCPKWRQIPTPIGSLPTNRLPLGGAKMPISTTSRETAPDILYLSSFIHPTLHDFTKLASCRPELESSQSFSGHHACAVLSYHHHHTPHHGTVDPRNSLSQPCFRAHATTG